MQNIQQNCKNFSDDSSTSSDDDELYLPVGLSKMSLNKLKPQTVGVLSKKKEVKNDFEEISSLKYESLLNRASAILKASSENSDRKKLKLVVTRKNRKTQVNVAELAIQMNRQIEHLTKFILSHLYSEGAVNESGILNIDGRFVQSEIESVLRNFIESYVICKSCDNVDSTVIIRENRLYFVKCENCNSRRCVGNVIDGFNLKEEAKQKNKLQ